MSYEHRLVEAANGREFYDKIGRDADAEIAALTEKLRAVETERDEAKSHEADANFCFEAEVAKVSALRAELERKDAALKAYERANATIATLQAQVAQLRAALEEARDMLATLDAPQDLRESVADALAQTPTEALARWNAMARVCEAARAERRTRMAMWVANDQAVRIDSHSNMLLAEEARKTYGLACSALDAALAAFRSLDTKAREALKEKP